MIKIIIISHQIMFNLISIYLLITLINRYLYPLT
jgi:hypothetical protein